VVERALVVQVVMIMIGLERRGPTTTTVQMLRMVVVVRVVMLKVEMDVGCSAGEESMQNLRQLRWMMQCLRDF
jgi:hypothetical protein